MKKFIVLFSLIATSSAHADIINCVFTEPFVNSSYSMAQSSLTYKNFETGTTVIKNVSFQIKSAGVFELVAKNGKVLQRIALNNQGSDGMSNRSYPYDVKDSSMDKNANSGYGGCSSNSLKASEDSDIPSPIAPAPVSGDPTIPPGNSAAPVSGDPSSGH